MTKFAKLLIEERKRKNMTKKDAATFLDWSAMYYGRFENGYLIPKNENIKKFALFLGISETKLNQILKNNE